MKIIWHVTSSWLLGNTLVTSYARSFPLFTLLQEETLTHCLATKVTLYAEYFHAVF